MSDFHFCLAATDRTSGELITLVRSIRKFHDTPIIVDALNFSSERLHQLEDLNCTVVPYDIQSRLPRMFPPKNMLKQWIKQFNGHVKKKQHRNQRWIVPCTRPVVYQAVVGNVWRLFSLYRISKSVKGHLIWMDSDCLVRKPLDRFFDRAKKFDLLITQRRQQKGHSRFLASIFSVRLSDRGRGFLALANQLGKKEMNLIWYVDQLCLWLSACKTQNIKIGRLTREFNDSTFNDLSPIWHLKHKKRSSHVMEMWREEVRRLENGI